MAEHDDRVTEDPRPGRFSLAGENERLRRENAELKRLVDKAPPSGPDAGTAVCFRRASESACRGAVVLSDGFIEAVAKPGGMNHYALIEYGDRGAAKGDHGFQVNRCHSAIGEPDTWHLPEECPFEKDPKVCPFAAVAPRAPETP